MGRPTYSNNLNGKVLNAVIDFDFIVNTDMGLIRFIKNKYQDPKAFKLDILNKSDRELLSLLYLRENPNPLSIISVEENMNNIDALYNSFFEEYKQKIIDVSTAEKKIVSFVNMVLVAKSNFGINPSIAVRDDIEKEEIRKHFNFSIFTDKKDIISIKTKDPFYIKDYRFFTDNGINADDIINRKIYTSPTKYNMNYIANPKSKFSTYNEFILMGKDYSEENITNERSNTSDPESSTQ